MSIFSEIAVAKLKDDCLHILEKLDANCKAVKALENEMYEAIRLIRPSKMRNVLERLNLLAEKQNEV